METDTLTTPTTVSASSEERASSQEFADPSSQDTGVAGDKEASVRNGERPLSAGQKEQQSPRKELSRYERTKRERAAFKAQREAFEREREMFAQERRALEEAKKPKRNYTLDELKKYRQGWDEEGKYKLVEEADAEIAAMEAEEKGQRITLDLPKYGTKEHEEQWHQMEAQIKREEPDFMMPGTALDTEIRKLFAGPNAKLYRDHPYGIYAAYSEAKKVVLTEENKALRSHNQQLESELKRLTGLTAIGGSAPGRVSSGRVTSLNDFSRLSSADMLKHLKSQAGKGEGMPWL